MQRRFDEQMQDLLERLVIMGRLAESMIQMSLRCLIERNEEMIDEVHAKEEEVNDLQIEIDDRALKLTALQQPVGGDVRFMFMASRIATELERIGDQAVNICQNAKHILRATALRPLVDLPRMGEIAEAMVHNSIDSLIAKDCALANEVLELEKEVDAFRDHIFRVLLTYMMSDPGTIQRALSLILISRNLERVGDHATNIAEEVIYLVEGREVRHRTEIKARALDSANL
jgi:phosphate transport system protein